MNTNEMNHPMKLWCTPDMYPLFAAMSQCYTLRDMALFMRDLCSSEELTMLAKRWKIARMIFSGLTSRQIRKETGAGFNTIHGVRDNLNHGTQAFKIRMGWRHDGRHKQVPWTWPRLTPVTEKSLN